MSGKRRSIAAWVRWGGTILSLGLFAWLLTRLDWNALGEQLTGLNTWMLVLALGLYLISQGFNNLRWCSLLWSRGVKISYWQAFRIAWSGIFASNFLPSTIGGDGLRMVAILPYTNSKSVAVGSVALDRLINMAAMACLLPLPFVVFGAKLNTLLALALPFDFHKLAERYFPKIVAAIREWAIRPAAFGWAFLAAWPSNLTFMLANFIVARELGMEISFVQMMAIQTVAYFFSVLPISVNGYGVREVTFTTLLVALGASLEQASAMAILTRFMVVLVTLPGALWFSGVASDVAEKA
jgi:glycosyltransferase 2 family protein